MLTLKIRRDTIRANPEYGVTKRMLMTKCAEFKAIKEALVEDQEGCFHVKYEGWELGVNYHITSVDTMGTTNKLGRKVHASVEAIGFCVGPSLPKMMLEGAKWVGVTMDFISNDIVIDADHREFLFEYEDLPERVACPHCTTEFGGAMLAKDYRFEDGACLVCGHELVKYEELDDVLRELQNETRDDRFSDN